jgi:hypothetical protein
MRARQAFCAKEKRGRAELPMASTTIEKKERLSPNWSPSTDDW